MSHCHYGLKDNSQPCVPPHMLQSLPLYPPFPLSSRLSSPSTNDLLARGQVGHLVMVVVVRANLLHQAVVRAVEGNIDTDDLERLRANPGHVALDLLLVAGLGRVVVAQRSALAAIHFLIVHAAVEYLGVLGIDYTLTLQVKLHCFDRRHQVDWDVALSCWVVSEVDAKRAVTMIHNLAGDQQVKPHCLDIGIEISPAKHLFELAGLNNRPAFDSGAGGVWFEQITAQHLPELLFRKLLFGERNRGAVGKLQGCGICSSAFTVQHPATQGRQGCLPTQKAHRLGGVIWRGLRAGGVIFLTQCHLERDGRRRGWRENRKRSR